MHTLQSISSTRLDGSQDLLLRSSITRRKDNINEDTNLLRSFSKLVDLISKKLENIDRKSTHKGETKSDPEIGNKENSGNSPVECHGHHWPFRTFKAHRVNLPDMHTRSIDRFDPRSDKNEDEPKKLAGDFDSDGDVDLDDLNIYRNTEGSTGKKLAADANNDGIVDGLDRQILLDNFGKKLE